MEEDVSHGQEDVGDDADVVSLLPPGLSGGPEESVNGVLAWRIGLGERAEGEINLVPNAEKSLSATSIMLYIR